MTSISVKESEQSPEIVQLPIKQNRLTVITLERSFPGACGLMYRIHGQLKAVGVASSDQVVSEPFFEEPIDGWTGNIFFTIKQPTSRPKSQDEPPIVDCCRDYMLYSLISETAPGVFENGLIKNCVTVATSQFAFMAGHCLPKGLPKNKTFQVYSRKNESYDVRLVHVKRYDESGDDFGIIEIQNGSFPHFPPATTLPEAGVSYFILGYDAEYPSVDHLSCFKGTFRNTKIYLNRNYVIGSPGTTSGCSGAGVFSMSGTLYGICVSGRLDIGGTLMTLNSHLQTLQTKLSEPSYSHIIPGNYLLAFLPDLMEAED